MKILNSSSCVLIIVQYKDDERYSLSSITDKKEEYRTRLLERLKGIDRRARDPQEPSITHRERERINSSLLRKRGLTEAGIESIFLS
jgi:hypothetical protein